MIVIRGSDNVGQGDGNSTATHNPNPSHALLREAMAEALKIQGDAKSGSTKELEQDAKEINNSKYNKQDGLYQKEIGEDLRALGLPNVVIEGGNEGPNGEPLTDIVVNSKTSNGGDRISSYWATANGPNSAGASTEVFLPNGSSATPDPVSKVGQDKPA